jgi:hypothetical protein
MAKNKNKFELRLVDYIAVFHFWNILTYTADDIKSSFPEWLIILGIVLNGLTIFVWYDHIRTTNYINSEPFNRTLYLALPYGIILTFSLSLLESWNRGELNTLSIDDILRYFITIIPLTIYFFHLKPRKRTYKIKWLTNRSRMLNMSFIIAYCTLLFLESIIK